MLKIGIPGYVIVEIVPHPTVVCVAMLVPSIDVIIFPLTVVKVEHVVMDALLVNAALASADHVMHVILAELLVKGRGALVFGLIIVCILAAVGIFICAALGAKGVKEISERHVHVLRKRTLVNDFIVSDLAADSDECSFADLEMGPVGGSASYNRVSSQDHTSDDFTSGSSVIHQDQHGEQNNYFSAQQQRTLDRMGLI